MTTLEILQGVHDWTNGKIVYDISVAHPDGQGKPTPYADLASALGAGGANIPEGLRKGGMSVKFIQGTVQSSDNKYVQYRLMHPLDNVSTADVDFVNIANWQGVDAEPTAGSRNLVESGGVAKVLYGETIETTIDFSTETIYSCIISNDGAGTYKVSNLNYPEKFSCYIIDVQDFEKVTIQANGDADTHVIFLASFPTIERGSVVDAITETTIAAGTVEELFIPANCLYIYVDRRRNSTTTVYTPSSFKLKNTTEGLSDKVEKNTQDIEEVKSDIEELNVAVGKISANNIELSTIPYAYLNGEKIYLRSAAFNVFYAFVKKGTYRLIINGRANIQAREATRIGCTNTRPAENVLYTPLVSYTYKKSEEKEILFSVASDCYVVIGNYISISEGASLRLETLPVTSKDYDKNIIHVQKDGHGRYTSLVDAIDSVEGGTPTDIYIHIGTYNLNEDWTNEQIANANYENVVNGVEGAWCGTPVKDNMTLIGFDGRKKVVIHAELPEGGATNNEISTFNPMGNMELRDLTISSSHLRYTIHDDFPYNNVDKVHKYVNCDILKYTGSQPAIGAARCSGESIIIDGCYVDYFTCHAATSFTLPSVIHIKNSTINYALGIIDHNTGIDCPVILENANVGLIDYGTSAPSGTPKYATLTIYGGNIPMITSKWESYIHDGISLKKSLTSNILRGKAVKCNSFYSVEPLSSSDDNSTFFGIALTDAPAGANTPNNAYPIITNGYVPTSLVGITTYNVGDTVGIVNGEVVISSTNIIGRVVCQDGTDGYILLN